MKNKQIILVTGASSGIGKATALTLIRNGHTVYGVARRTEKMLELTDAGGHALYMDVMKPETIKTAIHKIISEAGTIDVLVNNAGYALYGAVEDVALDDARRQFEVNLFGLAAVTKQVLPIMREKRSGKIVNLSSMGGKIYTPLGAWYHATKHAVEGWSDCLRLELKPFGINVVIIEPGIIHTEFGDVLMDPLLDVSGKGPYSEMAQSVARATRETYDKGQASSPTVVAKVIARAVDSRKPKTRYVKGKLAKPLMLIRKYLGDRIFDRVVMMQV